MGIRIFLDDERHPKTEDFSFISRSYKEFKDLLLWCKDNRIKISYISWDHDLAEEKNGKDCANLLVEMDMDYHLLAEDFQYNIHSANTPGRDNIASLMNNYLEMRSK